ncbi:MAG: hypothetical protein Tsb009_20770 [Planctomycetaceae bacterium]
MLSFSAILLTSIPLFAAEPSSHSLLPKTDPVTLECSQPGAIFSHPFFGTLSEQAAQSRLLSAIFDSPRFDRFRSLIQLTEQATKSDWQTLLSKLTAGGMVASFQPGKNGGVSLVMTTVSSKFLKKSLNDIRRELLSRISPSQQVHLLKTEAYRNRKFYRLGNIAYLSAGKQLLIASSEARLKHMIDRLPEKPIRHTASPSEAGKSTLRIQLDLQTLRKTPGLKKALQTPASDVGQVAILGGWLDILRHSSRLNFKVVLAKESLGVQLESALDEMKAEKLMPGFFAFGSSGKPAPLLMPAGTIYSASWFRDYRTLWQNRGRYLTKKTASQLEKNDQTVQQQLSVIGGKTKPSVLFSGLGTHFRLVVLRQKENDYKVNLNDRFPAFAGAVDLRDESQFREQITPFLKGLGLILTFGEQKMLVKNTTYRGQKLTSIRFRDDPVSASRTNQFRFQFSPTYCIAHHHFIMGSTVESVRKVLDELMKTDIPFSEKSSDVQITERQYFSFEELANVLSDVQNGLAHRLTFSQGLSSDASRKELAIFANILKRFGKATATVSASESAVRYHVQIHFRSLSHSGGSSRD